MNAVSQRAARIAKGWLGTPYLHQESVRGVGCDCLGLVRGVWRELYGSEPGEAEPYSPDWSEYGPGERLLDVAGEHLRPVPSGSGIAEGQVLVFRMRSGCVAKHLGILTRCGADAAFIHAYSGHGVVESPYSDPWRRRTAARFSFPE